jgi:hypothetical protein
MIFRTTADAVRAVAFRVAIAGPLIATAAPSAQAQQSLPATIASPGSTVVMTTHGVGAQIYQCVADPAGKLDWQFREPVATLLIDTRTVGRHFAGPSWELSDGSLITGKVLDRALGATPSDIPWLKLEATTSTGQFATTTIVQRINTKGGALSGACDKAGELIAVPYASDYIFLTKGG